MRFGEKSLTTEMWCIKFKVFFLLHIRGTILNILPFLLISLTTTTNSFCSASHSAPPLFFFFITSFWSKSFHILEIRLVFLGEMRLPELTLVVWLLVWACIGSNTVARKNLLDSNLLDGAKRKNTSVALDDAHKCNPKILSSCNTTSSDDKRVVPTGPNPLHNR